MVIWNTTIIWYFSEEACLGRKLNAVNFCDGKKKSFNEGAGSVYNSFASGTGCEVK